MSVSEARKDLFPLIKRVDSRNDDAVLMSAEDYDSWQETIHLPAPLPARAAP
ncbi:type II toxin-antitoxin system prevent-host-death family antitoxin [Streptomyces sp. NPDC046939]|uniref:type II toxin-antitoxin system Phd/YefM family antitoxin n=1 Tax=Streptomyces sp. NPDC046939 TaxID=3155376 RepID=UPI0033C5B567